MTNPDAETISLIVAAEDAGTRIDRFLASKLSELSRSRLQTLIRAGHVAVAGQSVADPGLKLKCDDAVTVVVPPPAPAAPRGEAMALNVVYEDQDVIVIDKPAGLVVHPAAGHAEGTLVNALIAHCGDSLSGIGGVRRPGIVHRLDKDTSGLLVVAKNDAAHQALSDQFAAHGADGQLQRSYRALVWGALIRPSGFVDAPLGRSRINRVKMAVVPEAAGRHAVTHYEVAKVFADTKGNPAVSLLNLELETGRTHQIRVHLAHIGHPVLGDQTYGVGFKTSASRLPPAAQEALQKLNRQALHAAELGFTHPSSGKALHFTSPMPADMAALVEALTPPPPPATLTKKGAKAKSATPAKTRTPRN